MHAQLAVLVVHAYPLALPTLAVTAVVLLTYGCAPATHDPDPEPR